MEHKLDEDKYIPILMELGQIMVDDNTDNMELKISTPSGSIITFEIIMKLKMEDK